MKIWHTPTIDIPEEEVKRYFRNMRKKSMGGDFPNIPSGGAVIPSECWDCNEPCWGSENYNQPRYCPECLDKRRKKGIGFTGDV